MTDEAERLVAGLHKFERAVLPHLAPEGTLSELAKASGLQEVEAMRALQWLEGKGCLKIATEEREFFLVQEKGKRAAEDDLPEHVVIREHRLRNPESDLLVEDVPKLLPSWDRGATGAVIGRFKRMGIPFIKTKEGKSGFKLIKELLRPKSSEKALLLLAKKKDWEPVCLDELDKEDKNAAQDLTSRQGYASIEKRKEKRYALTPLGRALAKTKGLGKTYAERVTPKMLEDGSWKGVEFRPYNVTINVPAKAGGRVHFVNEAIASIKRVWLDMGFEEMTGEHVQTAFWDLDALFVPQDHPAREMQDTFYLEAPAVGKLPAEVLRKVRAAHEHGGDTGSLGWRYAFDEKESARNLLRTHTTVLSARTLDAIRRGAAKMPGKYFSVSTIYRNEALDWKHLFELHQVEGIVVAPGMTLAHLKGYLRAFFTKMGFADVRIRPAHFPYTEPSAEVDVWDPQRKAWVELGGAGIFRPEVTKTLIGKEVPVLAWGLGMERTIMRRYAFEDIRDIYRNDLEQLKTIRAWLQ